MKKLLIILLLCFGAFSCNKDITESSPEKVRYLDDVFSEVSITSNVLYGNAMNINGNSQDLLLDIYEPSNDGELLRPLLIYAHGGGFKYGDKSGGYIPEFCKSIAKKGYVVLSINYRLGIKEPQEEAEVAEALYRGQQDARAAIRFARAHANVKNIDTTKIYIAGSSAGGGIALHLAFWDVSEIPTYINQTIWGTLEGNSGTSGYSSSISGVINMWGAIGDTLWIENKDFPVKLIHSENDAQSPYISGINNLGVFVYGSYAINERCHSLGIPSDLYTYSYVGHGEGLEPPLLSTTIKEVVDFLYPLVK